MSRRDRGNGSRHATATQVGDNSWRLGELVEAKAPRVAITRGALLALPSWAFEDPFHDQLMQGLKQLLDHRDVTATRLLLGCGAGLTPAGDDLLLGVLVGTGLLREDAFRKQLTTQLAFFAASRTTALAARMLDEASAHRYPRPIAELCDALIGGSITAIECAAKPVAGLGHSSGRAVLCGLRRTATLASPPL